MSTKHAFLHRTDTFQQDRALALSSGGSFLGLLCFFPSGVCLRFGFLQLCFQSLLAAQQPEPDGRSLGRGVILVRSITIVRTAVCTLERAIIIAFLFDYSHILGA